LLFSLPGGVLVDRVDRRWLMLLIDVVRVAALAVLATAVLGGYAGVGLLYSVLFVVNSGEVVFRSASQAMIPVVVPREKLERANGLLFGGTMLMHGLLAGPIGGVLFAVTAALPFLVNAATYAASAALLGLIAGTYRTQAQPGRRSMRAEVAEGFRWLMGNRVLRTMSLLIGLLNLTLTAATAVLVLLAKERLHLGSIGFGLLFGCMAVGGLVGAVVGERIIARLTSPWTLRGGLVVEAGTHLTLATVDNPVAIGGVLFLFGLFGARWGSVSSTLRQRLVPAQLLGRVGSTSLFLAAGGNCAGAFLGGFVAAKLGLTAPCPRTELIYNPTLKFAVDLQL
jgi:MFS family permease